MAGSTPTKALLADVLEALPPVKPPMCWQVVFVPAGLHGESAFASVELLMSDGNGANFVFRRWGRRVRPNSPGDPFAACLTAANEARYDIGSATADEMFNAAMTELQLKSLR